MTERMMEYQNLKKIQMKTIREGTDEQVLEMMLKAEELKSKLTPEDWRSLPKEFDVKVD